MNKTLPLFSRIYRDGFHFVSTYWQTKRKALSPLPSNLLKIGIAMGLSDATLSKTSKDAHIKFEQGYKELFFVNHLSFWIIQRILFCYITSTLCS